MVPKIYYYHNFPPILPILQKFVLQMSEHGDIIEAQTIILYLCNMHITQSLSLPKFSSKLGPCYLVTN